jgi:phenylalanyl-tRNA synthetase alpha chain
MQDLGEIVDKAYQEIIDALDIRELEAIRVKYIGKKGVLTEQLKSLGKMPKEERPKFGQAVNKAKVDFEEKLRDRKLLLESSAIQAKIDSEKIDVTLPGRNSGDGTIHPITMAKQCLEKIFMKMGYMVSEGPEIESDFYNFEALNIPSHHPARAMHDTFYLEDGNVLRTHTSPVQIRAMHEYGAPLYMVAPGRCYRCDSDLTHTPMFHQIEGLVIDKDIHFGHLKGVIKTFLEEYFEKELNFRFRPSYFPFTEPSAEVDMSCPLCDGNGCRVCSNTGWLEILGCGMVHPKVLEHGRIDSKKYQGFAFGLGVDRMAMLKYGIDDLRINFEGDLKFLQQFSG